MTHGWPLRYGRWAQLLYCLANLYRLYTEVWSNTVVVSEFYGAATTNSNGKHTGFDADWWVHAPPVYP